MRDEEGAFEVEVEDGVVVGFGDVPEVSAFLDAGVVDEDVAAAELIPGGVDEGLAAGGFGDVGLHGDGLSASLGGDLFLGIFGAFGVAVVVDDEGCAFAGEADGDGLADAGGGSCDDGDFACKTTFGHACDASRAALCGARLV